MLTGPAGTCATAASAAEQPVGTLPVVHRAMVRLYGPRVLALQTSAPVATSFTELQHQLEQHGIRATRTKKRRGVRIHLCTNADAAGVTTGSVRRAALIAQAWLRNREHGWGAAAGQVKAALRLAREMQGGAA